MSDMDELTMNEVRQDNKSGEQLPLPSSPLPSKKKKKRQPRSLKLIADFDEDGFAKGWRFAVPRAFRDTLDIKLTERKEPVMVDGKPVYETVVNNSGRKSKRRKTHSVTRWTQGTEYSFAEGHVLYDTPKAYRVWKEALQHITYIVEILRSTPTKWDEHEGKRLEGSVTFLLQKPNAERTGLEKIDQHSLTQTKFVEFLRTGVSESITL